MIMIVAKVDTTVSLSIAHAAYNTLKSHENMYRMRNFHLVHTFIFHKWAYSKLSQAAVPRVYALLSYPITYTAIARRARWYFPRKGICAPGASLLCRRAPFQQRGVGVELDRADPAKHAWQSSFDKEAMSLELDPSSVLRVMHRVVQRC